MQITFYGRMAKRKKLLISQLIEFCLKKFIADLSKIKIEIEVSNSDLISENIAEISTDKDDPYLFTIEIGNRQNFGKLMLAIAHECVHIKQYLFEEIEDCEDDTVIFLEEKYDTSKIDYWDLPWEIEANGREHGLLLRFVEANNLQNEEWLKVFQ